MKYNIGDFVTFDRYHLQDQMGVIVKKINDGRNYYMISIKEYGGDYTCMMDNHIISRINLPVENKLELIGSFGDWWYKFHKNILQSIIIEALN
tara:strand:- start:1253 stop:1531 length:279 start_codon:yes stop_codon:yes gene_type:complete